MLMRQSLRLRPHQGFTLVEVLLVVTLFALMAAFLVPSLSVGERSKTDTFSARVEVLLAEMSEYSVYSGELMALRITETHLTPMRFVSYDEGFIPYTATTGGIKPLAAPAHISLRWQSEEAEAVNQADPEALQQWQESDASKVQSTEFGKKEISPEVFFYPSGEASAGALLLYQNDTSTQAAHRILLNALGRPALEREDEA